MRIVLLLSALLATAAMAGPVPYQGGLRAVSTLLPPGKAPPQEVRYAGGYTVAGKGTARLIGLSDLIVTPAKEGVRVDAVSDYGDRVHFTVPAQGGEGPLEIDALRGPDGEPFGNKALADSEDMAIDPQTQTVYVSFEGDARVMRYAPGMSGKGQRLPLTGLPALPGNEGLEALIFHRDGAGKASLILGAEVGGFWQCGLDDYVCRDLIGPTTPGFAYKLVSLAPLDPSRPEEMLALYRFYTPWTGARSVLRVLRLDGRRLVLTDTLLTLAPPLPNDNYEGVSAVKTADGYRLYLISDPIGDNDPTRLLMFEWTR